MCLPARSDLRNCYQSSCGCDHDCWGGCDASCECDKQDGCDGYIHSCDSSCDTCMFDTTSKLHHVSSCIGWERPGYYVTGSVSTCYSNGNPHAQSCSRVQCPAGTYSPYGTSCRPQCWAGTYSGAGASSCTNCAPGKFSGARASSCTNCASGTWSGGGASSCTPCEGCAAGTTRGG